MSSFAERLIAAMQIRQVKLADVAAAVGKSVQTVHKWTNGGDIEHDTLKKLAAYFDLNWVILRYGEQELIDVCCAYPYQLSQTLMADIIDSERRHIDIVQAMDLGIWEYDPARHRFYGNDYVWKVMTGEDRSSGWKIGTITSTIFPYLCEENIEHFEERKRFAQTTAKNGDRFLVRFKTKWRPDVWVLGYGIINKNANGRITRIFGFIQEEAYRNAANEYFKQLSGQQKRRHDDAL